MHSTNATSSPLSVWHLIFASLIAVVIIISGIALAWFGAARDLRANALEEASHWAQFIKTNVRDFDKLLLGEDLSTHDYTVLEVARTAHNVFRYVVYDKDGRIMFSSDFTDAAEYRENTGKYFGDLEPELFDGQTITELEDGRGKPDRPDDYAETYFPITTANNQAGFIEVYIDQTDRIERYWDSVIFLMSGIGLLIALAAILPVAFIRAQYERIRRAEAHIIESAYLDSLTGLANRRGFQARMEEAVKSNETSALLLLDLDHFKPINDTYGHQAGDALLQRIASTLRAIAPENSFVARIGGDEFAIILPREGDSSKLAELAEQLIESVAASTLQADSNIRVGLSIGISTLFKSAHNETDWFHEADVALYKIKNGQRGGWGIFQPGMEDKAERSGTDRRQNVMIDQTGAQQHAIKQDRKAVPVPPTANPL